MVTLNHSLLQMIYIQRHLKALAPGPLSQHGRHLEKIKKQNTENPMFSVPTQLKALKILACLRKVTKHNDKRLYLKKTCKV